jgi:hypothetical protein
MSAYSVTFSERLALAFGAGTLLAVVSGEVAFMVWIMMHYA